MNARPAGYADSHANTPALIMGNGPSLARVEFEELGDFACFGMNAAYRYWAKIGWWPEYYSCLDLVVGQSHREAISDLLADAKNLGIKRFLLRHKLIRRLGRHRNSERITCYEELLANGVIPKLRDVTTGSHTFLWAQSLGYRILLLGGIDCNYDEFVGGAEKLGGHLKIANCAPNPNYFFDGYQQPGDEYNVPNLVPNMHVRSWRNVARYQRPDTCTVNLNHRSRVDAFPRNFNANSFLSPGQIDRPESSASEGSADEIGLDQDYLRQTVQWCNKLKRNASAMQVREELNRMLQTTNHAGALAWQRARCIHLSEPNEPLPIKTLEVQIGIGGTAELSLLKPGADSIRKFPNEHTIIAASSLLDSRRVAELLRELHIRLHACRYRDILTINARELITLTARILPVRLRSANYRSLWSRIRCNSSKSSRRSRHIRSADE